MFLLFAAAIKAVKKASLIFPALFLGVGEEWVRCNAGPKIICTTYMHT